MTGGFFFEAGFFFFFGGKEEAAAAFLGAVVVARGTDVVADICREERGRKGLWVDLGAAFAFFCFVLGLGLRVPTS